MEWQGIYQGKGFYRLSHGGMEWSLHGQPDGWFLYGPGIFGGVEMGSTKASAQRAAAAYVNDLLTKIEAEQTWQSEMDK